MFAVLCTADFLVSFIFVLVVVNYKDTAATDARWKKVWQYERGTASRAAMHVTVSPAVLISTDYTAVIGRNVA